MSDTPTVLPRGERGLANIVSASRRVAIVGPSGTSVRHMRGPLIRALLGARHQVRCLARSFSEGDAAALQASGAVAQELPRPGSGLALLSDWREVSALTAQFEDYKPSIVLAYGADTLLPAIKAAHWAKVERIVALIHELPGDGRDQKPLRAMSRALELADMAVFHNHDQPKWLKAHGLLAGDLPYIVVPGSGVDLEYHGAQPLPDLAAGLVFLMIARLDRSKGVLDYLEAAKAIKARGSTARFLLAGLEGGGAHAIAAASLEPYRASVEFLGPGGDAREFFKRCHVYVYPSHNEGMPRSVLEALAAGRPVITSNGPGCRETVDERVNGVLVPPGDVAGLVQALESFLKRPDLIPAMARAARAKAERKFSQREVNAALFEVLGL